MATDRHSSRSFQQRPALVGRAREQERLGGLLADTLSGHGSLVLVSGEAGIGKTSLVRWLIDEAGREGVLVLSGGCYDLTTTPPYGPWSEAIRDYEPIGDQPPVPSWFGNPEELEKIGSQAALFEDARRFFAGIAGHQPLVIVLEDLHWSDTASLDALRYLGRTLTDAAILLVVTYRDDEITRQHDLYQLLPPLVRESRAVRVHLTALGEDDVREIVTSRYGVARDDLERLIDHVVMRSEGNPFFVEELLQGLEEERILVPAAQGWMLGELDLAHVPSLLRQVIDGRLARMSDETRAALQVAAVIGYEVPIDLWRASVETRLEMVTIVREAAVARVIDEHDDGVSLRFRHELIRQRLYQSLLLPERQVVHRSVAETMIKMGNVDPGVVALHLDQAQDKHAIDWWIRAGGRAERVYAPLVAIKLYERAIAILEQMPERDRERAWLLHRLARLYRWHDPERTLLYLRQAIEIARSTGDQTLEAYSRFDYGLSLRFTGDVPGSIDEMIAGVEAIDSLPPEERERSATSISSLFAETIPDGTQAGYAAVTLPGSVPGVNLRKPTLAWLLVGCGRFDEAKMMANAVIDQLHAAGLERDEILVHGSDAFRALGVVNAVRGHPEQASYYFQMARDAAEVKDDHQWIAATALLELLFVNLPFETDQPDARRRLKRLIEWKLETVQGLRPWLDEPTTDEMQILLINGQWTRCRALALRFLRETPPRAPFLEQARAMSILATLDHQQGRPDETKRWIGRLFPHGPSVLPEAPRFLVHERARRLAIDLALDEGELASAGEWLDAHEAWLDAVKSTIGRPETDLLRARHTLLSGEVERARCQALAARERAREPGQPNSLIAIERFLGELDLSAGKRKSAQEHLLASLDLAERCELPYELALSRLSYSEFLTTTGAHRDARQILDKASTVLEELEARPAIEQAKALAERIDHALGRQDHPAGLSDREVEVLELIAQGLTNAEAAEELFISPRTVGAHISSIYRKLGVNSRAAATRFAINAKLSTDAPDRASRSKD